MMKWINKNPILFAIICVLLTIGYFVGGYWYLNSEKQDIAINTNVTDGIITFGDSKVAKEGVCLPQVRQGEYLVGVKKDEKTLIEQKVIIGDVNQKIVEENKYDDAVLEVKLTNCKNWN